MANWQEALKKGGQAFHGEPGKPADASVNMYEGHYVAYAANNSVNDGWDENLSSAEAVSAYFRKHGVDPDTGWRSQWMAEPNAEELHGLAALIDKLMVHPLVTQYPIARARLEHLVLRVRGKQ